METDFFWDMRPCSLVRVTCTCIDIPNKMTYALASSVTSVHNRMCKITRLHIPYDPYVCHYLFSRDFIAFEYFLGQQNTSYG